MLYIDLFLSFVLFVLGIVSLISPRFRTNIWVSILALIFLPLSIFNYYFPMYDLFLFRKISVRDFILYPLVKLLIILALFRFIKKIREITEE